MAQKVREIISLCTLSSHDRVMSIALMSVVPCSLFFKKEMELSLIGLQNAGKTSLVNVIATGGFQEDMIPTVGFNMRKVSKGSVTIKLWDLGGQVCIQSFIQQCCCSQLLNLGLTRMQELM